LPQKASLPHEVPKLMPERAPLELQAQEPQESLLDLHAARLKRQDALEAREHPITIDTLLPGPKRNGNGGGGNGQDDTSF